MKKVFAYCLIRLNLKKITDKGFTLLELLIVVGIIVIISVAVINVINPAEMIKKSRDTQRISDLNALKKAISIYELNTPYPKLSGISNTGCKGTAFNSTWQLDTDQIYYSLPTESGIITGKSIDGVTFTTGGASQVVKANLGKVDGTGWLPVNFSSISGGSPISNLPVDPVNTIVDLSNPKSTDLIYRYVCSEQNLTYELGATLESETYTVTDNKMSKDGGDNDNYYETGTGLGLFNEESPSTVLSCGEYSVTGQDLLNYGTVLAADSRCWLDRNLGAGISATAYNDYLAYGSLFQWGRGSDGHQLINRTSSTTSIPVNGNTLTLSMSDNPNDALFIKSPDTPFDWVSIQNNTRWQGINGVNNPCPIGFRLPTQPEWASLITAESITNSASAFSSSLKLTVAGSRSFNAAAVLSQGYYGLYWSSTPSGVDAYNVYIGPTSIYPASKSHRTYGFSLRCIKD